jgi:Photosynthetic reaction centre cytochrome C subunit
MKALAVLLALFAVDAPVEQTKKNIKVLQGLPSSQLIPVMAFFANSLGVTCAHCHAAAWESDEKPAKETARKMIAMQRAINAQHFDGKTSVTCNSCHQGRVKPAATPDLANAGWNPRPAPAAARDVDGAEAAAALPAASADVTHRVIRGVVERFSGREEPKQAPFTLTIDAAKAAYATELSHPSEAGRALALYLLPKIPAERAAGERWIVNADSIQRLRRTATPFGDLPERIEYSDFRDTGTGRLPFRAQWSRADYRVTFTVMEVTR